MRIGVRGNKFHCVGFPHVKRHMLSDARRQERSGSPTYNFSAILYCIILIVSLRISQKSNINPIYCLHFFRINLYSLKFPNPLINPFCKATATA